MNNFLERIRCAALSLLLVLGFVFCVLQLGAENVSTNSSASARIDKQMLLFRNGDVLFGKLQSISRDKSVLWKRDDVQQPIEFFGTNLLEVQFPSKKKPASPSANACSVRLNNGDSFEGKLVQLDSENVALETSFAGKLTFPRKVVQAIEPAVPEANLIFSGPTGLDGWTIGKVNAPVIDAGEWKYVNGAFYATKSASIARDLKLPDVASIQFDLAWKGTWQMAIALYAKNLQPVALGTKDTEPDFGGFYSLQINSFVSTLMPVKQHEPLKYMGQIPVPAFSQKNSAHVEIRASKPKSSIALFVDGSLVKEWIDTEGFAGSGTAMRFVHQGQGAIKLSNLRIAEWNGKLEEKTTNAPPDKEDLAKLLNGDTVSGNVELFRDGKITFSIKNRKLDIPFGRVTQLQFASEKSERVDEARPVLRGFFHGGGRATFRVERWDNEGVVGSSPNFGRATFAPETFERIQLNTPPPTNKVAQSSSLIIFE
jgi:hypothetical protein